MINVLFLAPVKIEISITLPAQMKCIVYIAESCEK